MPFRRGGSTLAPLMVRCGFCSPAERSPTKFARLARLGVRLGEGSKDLYEL